MDQNPAIIAKLLEWMKQDAARLREKMRLYDEYLLWDSPALVQKNYPSASTSELTLWRLQQIDELIEMAVTA